VAEILFVPYPSLCTVLTSVLVIYALVFEKLYCLILYLLQYNTKYYYKIGEVTVREFWFTTPPGIGPDIAYTFGLIGKLSRILLLGLIIKDLPPRVVNIDMTHSEGK
jgi:hypothetical protein